MAPRAKELEKTDLAGAVALIADFAARSGTLPERLLNRMALALRPAVFNVSPGQGAERGGPVARPAVDVHTPATRVAAARLVTTLEERSPGLLETTQAQAGGTARPITAAQRRFARAIAGYSNDGYTPEQAVELARQDLRAGDDAQPIVQVASANGGAGSSPPRDGEVVQVAQADGPPEQGQGLPSSSKGSIPVSVEPTSWRKQSEDIPIVNLEADRRKAILNNAPATFEIQEDPSADASYPPWHVPFLGNVTVKLYQDLINEEAARLGVDPDLVKAIVYIENAHGGHYGRFSEAIGVSDSILPMNVRESLWSGLIGPDADFDDSQQNIRAGVLLIKRISERIENPTVAKIAALYNSLGLEDIAKGDRPFGAWVERAYREAPWKKRVELRDPNFAP